jgi:hypothetical protein
LSVVWGLCGGSSEGAVYLREIVEQWHITSALQVGTLALGENGVRKWISLLGLLGSWEDAVDQALGNDVGLAACIVLDGDVIHVGIDAQCKVAGKGPRRGGPGNELDIGVINKREGHVH